MSMSLKGKRAQAVCIWSVCYPRDAHVSLTAVTMAMRTLTSLARHFTCLCLSVRVRTVLIYTYKHTHPIAYNNPRSYMGGLTETETSFGGEIYHQLLFHCKPLMGGVI